jgi:hypothetical protein
MKIEIDAAGNKVMTADEGMTFANKVTGDIVGRKIYLGKLDSEENYREVTEPEETEAI